MAALDSAPLSFFRLSFSSNPPLLFLAKSNLPFPISTTKSYPLSVSRNKFRVLSSAIQEAVSVEEKANVNLETRLFVLNLPWSYSVDELKDLFGECGTVEDAEIIRRKKDGKSRGYAFVTMGSREEALSVIQKYDSYELMGRIIRVEFAKDSKKTSPAPAGEKSYKLYVSNLAWKVRANHLRDLFAAEFNPTSTRVVFETPEGKSAGFGFVTFASKEEAESAISALNGKELLGRPITVAFSKRGADKTETEDDNTPAETETAES